MAESARRRDDVSDERQLFEQFQEWRQNQGQSPMQGRAAEPEDENTGSPSSLLSRDQLVEEAAVMARKHYMQKKPDNESEGFDLVEIFQILPHIFEADYPLKTLNRSTYFGWHSTLARFFNRRFVAPKWQIALEGIEYALDHDMISPTHEDMLAYRFKVKLPPIGPPFILMSDRVGMSPDMAKKYGEYCAGEIGKDAFTRVSDDHLRAIQRDHKKLVKKLNRYRATVEEISEDLKKAKQGKKDLDQSQIDRLVEERKRYVSKVRDVQDEIETLQDELQAVKKKRGAS